MRRHLSNAPEWWQLRRPVPAFPPLSSAAGARLRPLKSTTGASARLQSVQFEASACFGRRRPLGADALAGALLARRARRSASRRCRPGSVPRNSCGWRPPDRCGGGADGRLQHQIDQLADEALKIQRSLTQRAIDAGRGDLQPVVIHALDSSTYRSWRDALAVLDRDPALGRLARRPGKSTVTRSNPPAERPVPPSSRPRPRTVSSIVCCNDTLFKKFRDQPGPAMWSGATPDLVPGSINPTIDHKKWAVRKPPIWSSIVRF